MKKILLLGGGGHCKSVVDTLIDCNEYDEIGIVTNDNQQPLFDMIPVVGSDNDLLELKMKGYEYAFITVGSVGNTQVREKLYSLISDIGFNIPIIIDRTAIVSNSSFLKEGTFVGKRAVINANSIIGKCSIINSAAVIEHDCTIGNFVHVSPNATLCGNVNVGFGSHIGAGATVIQGRTIGEHSLVGAGTVVIQDIEDNRTVVGNPAREIG